MVGGRVSGEGRKVSGVGWEGGLVGEGKWAREGG